MTVTRPANTQGVFSWCPDFQLVSRFRSSLEFAVRGDRRKGIGIGACGRLLRDQSAVTPLALITAPHFSISLARNSARS